MGHVNGKEIYKKLGKKLDGLTVRVPATEAFYNILKELYSTEEAELIVKMPYSLSTFEQIRKVTNYEGTRLRNILDGLCSKGLIIDCWADGKYWYMPSPLMVGIFEMTMMRTGQNTNYKVWAKLFHEYLSGSDAVFAANFGNGEKTSIIRALAHEEAIREDSVEVLDYETATSVIEQSDKFAIGYCSCRHEKYHAGGKTCDVPLDTCSSFSFAADYLIRYHMAKEVSKTEMLENISRSKGLKLVLTADNIKQQPTFICHCCKCCCNVLMAINKHGYPNALVTSGYISEIDHVKCTGCEQCAKGCPVDAIAMVPANQPGSKKLKEPKIDESRCLGCGVCALICHKDAAKLVKRKKRVILPETTFERVILQSLERGTLQNQLFDNPGAISHKVMRGIIGGFMRLPPVKRALMSDLLRSRFLESMRVGAGLQGKGPLLKL